jgi:hypothetical protein
MAGEEQAPRYEFGVREKRGLLGGLRTAQMVEMGAGVLLAFLCVIVAGAFFVALVMAMAGFVVAWMPIGSRNLDQWLPLVVRWCRDWALRRHRHVLRTHVEGRLYGTRQVTHFVIDRKQLPETLRHLELRDVQARDGSELGIVHDKQERTLTAALGVQGERFALMDPSEQVAACNDWAEIPGSYGHANGVISRIGWYERQIPDDGSQLRKYLDEKRMVADDDPALLGYDELIRRSGPATANHLSLLAVQVDLRKPRVRRMAQKAGKGDVIAGGSFLLAREMEMLATRLRQNRHVTVQKQLGASGLAMAIRSSYEPEVHRLRNIMARTVDANGHRGKGELDPDQAFPPQGVERWNRVWAGGMWHSTFWVAEWPRKGVGPVFMSPLLLLTDCVRTISMVMQPQPPLKAQRQQEGLLTGEDTGTKVRERLGFRTSVRQARMTDKAHRDEAELADGYTLVRFSAYVTVSSSTEEGLEVAEEEIREKAARSNLVLERLDLQHGEAITFTLPLCRGLVAPRR